MAEEAETPREDPFFLAESHGVTPPRCDARVPRVRGVRAWLPDGRDPIGVRHYKRAIEILSGGERISDEGGSTDETTMGAQGGTE